MRAEKLPVVSPAGIDSVQRTGAAQRLENLQGKMVCEVWNGVFKGDMTFPVIRKLLKERYPDLKIIPYTEFPHARGSDDPANQREHARRVAEFAREAGCSAVISGNGA